MPKLLSDADIAAFRDRLCDIAEEKFAALGPEGVTLRDLASTMGVSPMTPYRYFKDKDAILAAVRARAFTRFAEAMEKSEASQAKRAPGPLGAAYVVWALKNRSAYRLMFDTQQPTASSYPDLIAAMIRARSTMTAGWKRLGAAGLFKGDIDMAANTMWSAMHGAVMLDLAGLLAPPLSAAKLAARSAAAIMQDAEIGRR